MENEIICPAKKTLLRAKMLYVLGKGSVDMSIDIIIKSSKEAAEIMNEIDNILRLECDKCYHNC